MRKFYQTVLSSLLALPTLTAQPPVITAVETTTPTVEQWGKFELRITVAANWSNPYDYDDIRVSAIFTGPGGQTHQVEGFFMQDYSLNTQTGALTPAGPGGFRLRFAPDQAGAWTCQLSCTNASGTGNYPEQSFTAIPPGTPQNKGFVRSNQTNYLQLDDGTAYIPVGENIGWQNGNAYLDFNKWVTKLADNGGNFFRLWHCSWGLGIEWRNGDSGYAGLRKYKQTNAFYQDWLFDYCSQRGVYVMLCLHHHGQVSSQVNPNWNESPYNSANGGPCANTWDFFTNPAARAHVKNRLRYVLARWGYARSILAWELFNEVDWTDQFAQRNDDVADWHGEMSTFLKQTDPYQHLVTTSYAQDFYDPQTWNQLDIDFTQTHYYINTPNMERVLAAGARKYLGDFGKPTLNGEFGLNTPNASLTATDPDGIHLHNSLWATLFSGGMGAGAIWWWDSYVEPGNLYPYFAPVSALAREIPFHSANLAPAPAATSGVPADLFLTPTVQTWGGLADTVFQLAADGTLLPDGAALSSFLYGAQWNTQYRRPPTFQANYPQAGQFRVKTAGSTGQNPKIVVWLDGIKVFEQAAQINQTYAIPVPSGPHTIKVDNTGTDWILISGYLFTGLGSALDAYVLRSEDREYLSGWVLNNRYNHEYIKTNGGAPPEASGGVVTASDVQNGPYSVRYYNCLTGALYSTTQATATGGTLALPLPDLPWDLVFIAEQDLASATPLVHDALPVKLYPNPSTGPVLVAFELPSAAAVSVRLFDQSGWELHGLFSEPLSAGPQSIALQLPPGLPGGLYWLLVETRDKVGMAALEFGL